MKRKHEEERRSNGDQQEQSAKVRRIEYKLTQGTVKLGHAFKIAKGFERQKLGRRSKQAAGQEGEKDVPRIASEIIAIKVRTCDRAGICAGVILMICDSHDRPSTMPYVHDLTSTRAS